MTTPSPAPSGKPADAGILIEKVLDGLSETAKDVVPWFLEQMPLVYFQDTTADGLVTHLRAIIATKASGRPVELTLRSKDGSEWTLMRPRDGTGVLAEIVRSLPQDQPLRAAKVHTAQDGNLVVDTFEFGEAERFDPDRADRPEHAEKMRALLEYANEHLDPEAVELLTAHIRRCSTDYVETVTPLRLTRHWELIRRVSGSDGATVSLEPENDPTVCRIVVAASNVTAHSMLERIATRLAEDHVNIRRAYVDGIEDGDNGSISMIGLVVRGPEGEVIQEDSELWRRLQRDLLRLKWVDRRTLDLAYRQPALDLIGAEIVTALCDLSHQKLVKTNAYVFNRDRILRFAERNIDLTVAITKLFLARFDPAGSLDDERFQRRVSELRESIDHSVDPVEARTVLHSLLDAVGAIYRTNVYLLSRYALSLRIDPAFLQTPDRPELPYGVYFVHGRAFNGFHVRFRNIARGGVRAIRPYGDDQHARETERLYDEAYQLAYAQQLKNKDIPEGGAKAAILLEPETPAARSVKGFVDALLDLITPDEATKSQVIDRLGHDELLYLGPDENITPDLINWIVERAKVRGYPTPTALMSSKPGAGINHKEFGVTSEGVVVFLDVTLRAIGIDPSTDEFTLKLTGGPDGDVAGNCIRILHRDYGERARIVGIADGSGVGEDPEGLDHDELLRLVHEELPIGQFDRTKLSPKGRIVTIAEPDGVQLRNTLHNRLRTDAFLPCGGRPAAINETNWRDFLDEEGTPSSRLIVEGANLFLTPEARDRLSEAGAIILKDSSANKCGVVCSSFEIISSMLLSEEEFLEHKATFVEQVLTRLRRLARQEAELLVRVHAHQPDTPLPQLSIRLSRAAIRASDAIEGALSEHLEAEGELLRQLVLDHLPPILIERAGDRIWTDLPEAYLRWMMAKSLAMRMIYREGYDYLETMSREAIARLATRYLALERERTVLASELEGLAVEHHDRMAELLQTSGILQTMGPV